MARRHQVLKAANITASGNSGTLENIGTSATPTVVIDIDIATAPTGTAPSIQFSLNSVLPDGSVAQIVQGAALTGAGTQRIVATGVLDAQIQLAWVVTGTTPNFGSVSADIYLTSPDR